jgi:hypothetical protein
LRVLRGHSKVAINLQKRIFLTVEQSGTASLNKRNDLPQAGVEPLFGDPKIIIGVASLVTTTFALAFDVGYFSAIDIGWFSIFGISEHVVFAVRALPIAVGSTLLLGISLHFSRRLTISPKWFTIWLCFGWSLFLAVLVLISINYNHMGFAFSFGALAIATIVYYYDDELKNQNVAVLVFLISTMVMVTLIIGYISSSSYIFFSQQHSAVYFKSRDKSGDLKIGDSDKDSYKISSDNNEDSDRRKFVHVVVGVLVFSGTKNVLTYESKTTTTDACLANLGHEVVRAAGTAVGASSQGAVPTPTKASDTISGPGQPQSGHMRLVLWEDIEKINLCPGTPPTVMSRLLAKLAGG